MTIRSKSFGLKGLTNFFFFSYFITFNKIKDINFILLAISATLINFICIFYTRYKKNVYDTNFLQFSYVVSNKVFILNFLVEIPCVCLFYYFTEIFDIKVIIHFIILLSIYFYIYYKRKSQRYKVKNNFKTKLDIGILTKEISSTDLEKGSAVKIIKKINDKYIIKDYENREYEVHQELITDIVTIYLD